jgi:alpha-L-fucosidase
MMPVTSAPYQPTLASLQNYSCLDWFRNAKFGIWAHWSPQCVPEAGDWYARNMYIQGRRAYEHHITHYGHPSTFGYKEICRLWKAERWEPDTLIERYQRAGARYFVVLANHHCNFDCWDSTFHEWNSVRVGPHKDIVGL